jgi:hypothetical protein
MYLIVYHFNLTEVPSAYFWSSSAHGSEYEVNV